MRLFHASSARKALSLKRDTVFRLLVTMTALLGWIAGMGAAGIVGLENVYQQWQLEQKSRVSVYLMADSPADAVTALEEDLRQVPGVKLVRRLGQEETLQLLEPYFGQDSTLPLPSVIDVTVTPRLDRALFDARVTRHFPEAEIDDARDLLASVSHGVRFTQGIVLLIAVVVFVVMVLLVVLTVRAGLRGKRESLTVMQLVGATDGFVTDLVTRQVMGRSLVGWVAASLLGAASVLAAMRMWDSVESYISPLVWTSLVSVPLLLVLFSMVTAWLTAWHTVRR